MKKYNQNPQTILELQQELYDWEQYNFGTQDIAFKILGVCEEVGELCHAALKMKQGIRGSKQKHIDEMEDAIGDAAIYAFNVASARDIKIEKLIQFGQSQVGSDKKVSTKPIWYDTLEAYGKAYMLAGIPLNEADIGEKVPVIALSGAISDFLAQLSVVALHLDMTLEQIVRKTYAQVVQRDWVTYPQTGHPES